MKTIKTMTALVLVLALAPSAAIAMQSKTVVTSANQLPVYSYQLPAAPSALLEGPIAPVMALAEQLLRDDAKTLAAYEITDLSTREEMLGRRLVVATLKRDLATVKATAVELRAIQQREDRKLTAGLVGEIIAESCAAKDPTATVNALVPARLGALPWAQVDSWMKQTRAGFSTANPGLIIGTFKQQLDPVVAKNGNKVDMGTASSIVATRMALQCRLPVAAAMDAALGTIISKQAAAAPAVDIWKDRDVVLTNAMPGKPVTIAIWDSGVDMSLFKAAANPGVAVSWDGKVTRDPLLRAAGPYQKDTQRLMDLVKGSMDLQAGQQTAEATAFQTYMRGIKPEQAKEVGESLGFVGNYIHGTHVAGIATAGNPFARVKAIANYWPYRQEDFRLDRAGAEGRAKFYRDIVTQMKRDGVRVVNMSWRVSPAAFDGMLQLQGGHPDAEARKKLAQELYAIEKTAMDAAIKSAPNILFVAGAGNEANDSNFADYMPAGLTAPNLLTVGAVDRAGREALFTSIGGTVAVYANGVEVESFFPGGQRRALSGTSMASPQVAGIAAKLVALKPTLSAAQLRDLLVSTADQRGRTKLVNAKAAFAKAGVVL
ncbi:MAG TPA: S8 family serine peptidase [Sphingomonadaceae bacterium]|nr:S8 family serine peptidase [Sphingomonadaceae bacterium]